MEIKNIKVEDLRPADYNPRRWTKEATEQLKKSIKEFGLIDPIIANSAKERHNIVIGGHFRLKVAKDMGFKTVPVVYVSIPDIKQEKELNLRLNRNLGEWDEKMLAEFDIDLLKDVGFNKIEIDRIFDVEEDNFDAEAEYKKIKEAETQRGDLIQLGDHRLLCGDSTNPEDFKKLMGGGLSDLVFTDPPYNVNYDYTVTYVKGRVRKDKFNVFDDNKSSEDFTEFIRKVFKNCFDNSKEGSCFYCWHASRTEYQFRLGIEMAGYSVAQTLHWIKNGCKFSKGLDYLYVNEPCYFGWHKGKKHFNNRKATKDFKNIINLTGKEFEELPNLWFENRDKISEYGHPTQKPIRLAERAIKKHSNRGDIVLEPFCGSGSTLVACEQMERKCYAIELDPKYCDVIIKRWEKLTGKKSIKL